MEDNTQNPGLKWGLLSGALLIATHLAFFMAGSNQQFGLAYTLTAFFIILIGAVVAGIIQRRHFGGFIAFRPVLKQTFLVCVISITLFCVYQYVYYNFIDITAADKERTFNVQVIRKMMTTFQSKPNEIADAVKNLEATDYHMTIGVFFYKLVQYIIRYFVLACIVSLIIRRKAPVTSNI
ncbi:Protein of unknown function [Chitinophaga costaii]|uniref:DUF4199 domain-containing protein n=1 Tax=Chitinophaga costaii TaxID=1335309 RepID=A0A1C4CID0_9BACT|nr:DUF4199 domain-containing protein [Chitinophaga costaii]PUZ27080.1 DUF4199 domain-containing protein [Chitinophaga costaii]SCC18796.1 Protein of unknown function [Chitinophaga costaii]